DPASLSMEEPFGPWAPRRPVPLTIDLPRRGNRPPMTIIFVTHSIEEAVFLSDRVVVMSPRPGRIVEDLAIELDRPRAIEVRDEPAFRKYVAHLRGLLG